MIPKPTGTGLITEDKEAEGVGSWDATTATGKGCPSPRGGANDDADNRDRVQELLRGKG